MVVGNIIDLIGGGFDLIVDDGVDVFGFLRTVGENGMSEVFTMTLDVVGVLGVLGIVDVVFNFVGEIKGNIGGGIVDISIGLKCS
jgi:hypothetical protein